MRFGRRDYDPQTGRWTAPEPLLFAAGPNLYAYANSDPVNYRDPDGLLPLPVVTAGAGFVVGFGGSVIAQAVNGPTINWGDALLAAGVGAATGAVAPFAATSYLGAALLGGPSNLGQYVLTQWSHGDCPTMSGALVNLGTGLVGGVVGGPVNRAGLRFAESGWLLSPKAAATGRALNQCADAALNLSTTVFFNNMAGSAMSNWSW